VLTESGGGGGAHRRLPTCDLRLRTCD
jgi:hypothetical protein